MKFLISLFVGPHIALLSAPANIGVIYHHCQEFEEAAFWGHKAA